MNEKDISLRNEELIQDNTELFKQFIQKIDDFQSENYDREMTLYNEFYKLNGELNKIINEINLMGHILRRIGLYDKNPMEHSKVCREIDINHAKVFGGGKSQLL